MPVKVTKDTLTSYALLNSAGRKVCDYDGINAVTRALSSEVLTEPLEGGNLAAFNKVQAPDSVAVTLTIGGDSAKQATALASLKALKGAVGAESLCTLVSLADVTDNLAVESLGISHSVESGASLLVVELSLVRIRSVQVSKSEWKPKKATSADATNRGKVQTKSTAARLEDWANARS